MLWYTYHDYTAAILAPVIFHQLIAVIPNYWILIMSTTRIFSSANALIKKSSQRNFGVLYPALQKASDPIQQLFIEKLREYKKKSSGGQLVDPSPEIQRELKQEHLKLAKIYGGQEGVDMTKFPDFKFVDAKLDPLNLDA